MIYRARVSIDFPVRGKDSRPENMLNPVSRHLSSRVYEGSNRDDTPMSPLVFR